MLWKYSCVCKRSHTLNKYSGRCQASVTALTWAKSVNRWCNMKRDPMFAYALSDLNLEEVILWLLGGFVTDERRSCSLLFTDLWNILLCDHHLRSANAGGSSRYLQYMAKSNWAICSPKLIVPVWLLPYGTTCLSLSTPMCLYLGATRTHFSHTLPARTLALLIAVFVFSRILLLHHGFWCSISGQISVHHLYLRLWPRGTPCPFPRSTLQNRS